MDVAVWLRDLKLERYVSAFNDNDIDDDVLLKRILPARTTWGRAA